MLPALDQHADPARESRASGRSQEIQRLVGRALRAVIDRGKMGERTVWVDCDVIQADGGTRTAAITGGFVAVADALAKSTPSPPCAIAWPPSASASVGGVAVLDLNYIEDSGAAVDMNVVMTGAGEFVEVQGTAEQTPFGRAVSTSCSRWRRRDPAPRHAPAAGARRAWRADLLTLKACQVSRGATASPGRPERLGGCGGHVGPPT